MQQTYQCPVCRAPVAFGTKFCTNCGTTLNWAVPQQIQQPPPDYQQTQYTYHEYGQQTPEPKKTSPLLIASLALIATVVLVGGVILAIHRFSQETPSNTSPPTASPPSQSPPSTDNIQPAISGVAASPSETSCVITWVTDEPATSEVEYGTTTSYSSSTPLDENLVVSHTVSLLGLKSGTTYHFKVKSKDKAGNEAQSGDYTFTTSKPAPEAKAQILEHRLVVEHNPPAGDFTFIRGKVKNTCDVTLASIDVTIWVEYEVEGLEGRTFNMPGSIDLEPATFKPGEIRDFDVLLQNGAKDGYRISVSVLPQ